MDALPPPTAEGLLAKTPLAHVLVYVMERRMTGSLELRRPDGGAGTVVFVEGIPQKARTSDGVATLGAILVEHRVITPEQAAQSIEQRFSTGVLQGQILVTMGVIGHDTLLGGLTAQLEAKLLHLFQFPFDSHFAFYEGHDTLSGFGGSEIVQVDPLRVLWGGVCRNPSWDHVNVTVARVQAMGMRLAAHAAPERCGFAQGELSAAEQMRHRPVRMAELATMGLTVPHMAQLLAYFLLITKQLELVDAPEPSRMAPMPPPASQQVARVQLQARQVTRGPAIVEEHVPVRPDSRMSPMPRAYDLPNDLRPVVPPAAPIPAEAAAVPMPLGAPRSPIPPPPASGPPSSSRLSAAPPSVRMSAAPPASVRPGEGPRSSPPGRVAEDGLRSKILTKADSIDHQNHYEALGVANTAPREDIQKAFIALAKVWHPDKLPSAMSDVRDACSKVFARLSEANAVLTDPARRADYDKALKDGLGSADEQQKVQELLEASNNFQKALIFLKRNDTAQGEELARKALAADPEQADYLALVTWLDSQKPTNQNRDKTLALIAKLDEAIKLNANCERAYFYRGMLHKRVDNMKAAIKDLKKAVEINPHNLDAAREIRLHGMRSTAAQAPKADSIGGLFGKLFKK